MKRVTLKILYNLFMSILVCIVLFPFYVMLSKSLMTIKESVSIPVPIFPSVITFSNYASALKIDFFFRSLGNTLFLVAVNIVMVPLSAYVVAYGFAKIKFKGSGFFFSLGMSTVMIPSICCTVPLYVLYSKFGWLNTLKPMYIPQMFGGGMMNIFLIHQYLKGIPNTYKEAAKIDGANEFRIAFLIFAPLTMPVITLVSVNTFIGVWNDFSGPLTYISSYASEKWTLAISVFDRYRGAVTLIDREPPVQMAICTLIMVPPMIVFAIFQRTLISGVALSGIKG